MSGNSEYSYRLLSQDDDEESEEDKMNKNAMMIFGPVKCRFGGALRFLASGTPGCILAHSLINVINRTIFRTRVWSCLRRFLSGFWFPVTRFLFAVLCVDIDFQDVRNGDEEAKSTELSSVSIHGGNNHYQEEIIRQGQEITRLQNQLREEKEASELEISSLRSRVDEISKEKHTALQEKESALTRLSEIAGAKLKYNNPGITDLSDDNRPNKLAEKFSELYDNEWTEAFEKFEAMNMGELEIIERLCNLLKYVYEKCFEMAEVQRCSLTKNVTNAPINNQGFMSSITTPDSHILKKISDLQKDTALSLVPKIIETIKSDSAFKTKYREEAEHCEGFVEKCITLSWMMCVQEPPVHLHFDCPTKSAVDPNIFRHYTKNGTIIDYLVWPAMLLHKGGPLLQKGVFQPQ